MIRNTKNFNLKKPEQGDFYNVDDFNDNSDIIDAELESRKKAQEDDEKNIKGLTNPEYDDSGTVSGIDSFPAFLNKTKSKMNIFQWYRDFKAGMQFVLHAGQIVNNCVSSDADKPLAAAQGKALQDQLTKLYSDFKAKDASLEIGQVERGAYIYLRNKVTNNLLMLRLNEDDKKLVFNSEIDGQWGTETELVTKSDMKVLKKTDVQFSDGFAEISFPGLTYDSAVCINQEYKSSAGVQNLVFTAQVRPNELIIYARNANDGSSYNGIIHIMAIAIG